MMSSPRDLARFAELFWGNRLIEGERSLDVNGPALGGGGFFIYTYGSMVQRGFVGNLRSYGHTGGFPGTTTTLQRIPALGVTIAVTIDGSGTADYLANDLAAKILTQLDDPALNPDGSARRTAADRGDPDPPDPPVALPGDVCGDPTPDPALGGDAVAASDHFERAFVMLRFGMLPLLHFLHDRAGILCKRTRRCPLLRYSMTSMVRPLEILAQLRGGGSELAVLACHGDLGLVACE